MIVNQFTSVYLTVMSYVNKAILLIFCFGALSLWGQEKESDRLKKNKEELLKKIEFTEKLLQSTQENQSNLSENLNLLERKIQYRKDLLNNLDIQLSQLDADIADTQIKIFNLEKEILNQKEQYKKMILQAYKMRNSHASLIFVLSSESFNQANKRMEYLQQLQKYREDQIRKIEQSKEELELKLKELEQMKLDKKQLAQSKEQEQKRYVQDREKQKKTISDLQGKEQQLRDELAQQRKKAQQIDNAINAALNREFQEQQAKNKDKPLTATETKEITLSNKGFEANKGRLPWPVKGEITKGFGKQAHSVYANVFTYNNGVDITTVRGSSVRVVYKGEVTSVLIIPGAGKAVIVKHGNYRTIYSNLQETYVASGDAVDSRQEIGALLVNASGNSICHFEIRTVSSDGQVANINPTYWLSH